MIEPFSAAVLGGLAYDTAKAAITKWIGARVAMGIDGALRDRQLKRGRPAKDQRTELAAVITGAVEQTAAELFAGEDRLQGRFCKTLLQGNQSDWPLVNGTDLADLVSDAHTWITRNDPQPGLNPDPASHPYLAVLCRHIIAQFGFRAENNGTKNTVLYPRWNRFWTTELFGNQPPSSASARGAVEFRNDFDAPVGTVIQGQQVFVYADPAPSTPAWPHRFGTIPTLAAARQDRAVDKQLAQALNDGGGAVCLILSGMGGVGKTQIAANYALDQWSQLEVDLLVWVNASSRDTILAAFAQAGTEVCGANASDSDRATRMFLAWLAQPDAPRWLIVLDDLTDPGDLNDLWPPANQRGGTIVTTRRRDAALEGAHRTLIEVDLFTPEEARQYLIGRLKGNPIRLEQATALATDLGHLPLALAQAAAYILDQPGLTCAAYQGLLADRTIRLDDLSPDALPDGYPRSVDAAWSLSIEAANGGEPYGLAMGLLRVASLLDPAGIPADLFTCETIFNKLWDFMPTGSLHDPKRINFFVSRDITRGLGRLHRLGLIDFDGHLVRIHALIQRSIRDKLKPQDLFKLVNIVADALTNIWPEPEVARSTSAILRSNVDYLRHNCEPDLLERAHPLLIRHGDSLGIQGQVGSAAAYFEQLSQECLRQLGPEHGFTLEVRHRHAHWLGESGSAIAASNKFRVLYQIRSKLDGPTHPDTLRARHGFARWAGEKGDLATAISELETLLQLRLEILGPDDPETLTVRHDLAYWIGQSGNPTGAVAAFGTVLAERVRLLGPDHITTLAARQNLAYWMGEAGDLEEATAATEELLADRMRILGRDHLDVLLTKSTLARWRGRTGEVASAVRMNEELLEDCHHVLGPDHPFTLTTRHNLAHWRGAAGDPAAAVAQTEDLLADRIRILGPDHPDTLRTRQNLAVWTGEAGYVADAISALEQVLHDDRRVLGEDHPETLATRHNLARWQGKFGDKERAITAFEKLLPDFDRILKPDHRYTILARNNLDLLLNESLWDEESDHEGNISGGLASSGWVNTGGLGSGKHGSSPQAPFFPAELWPTASRSTKSFSSSKCSENEENGESEEESPLTRQDTGNIWGYVNPKDDPYC